MTVNGRIDTRAEFERQVDTFVERGYPKLAAMSAASFRDLFSGLLESLVLAIGAQVMVRGNHIPFVLAVTREVVEPEHRVPLLRLVGSSTPGVVDKNHWSDDRQGLAPYAPVEGLGVPRSPVYALVDIERGDEFRNIVPEEAVLALSKRKRTPLSIDEGISLATVFPGILEKNHCFMLAGSDRGDRRMPALWIAGKAPKLGWCYKGNPHSWLGVASAGARLSS